MEFKFESVHQALAGKRILITGASGFLGKVLLEKMLRDIPTIERITLLLRGSQRNPDIHRRFEEEILGSSVFDRMRGESASALQWLCERKVECIHGEQTAAWLGLEIADFHTLAQRTDLIINVAASVNFGEPMDQMLAINTLSLKPLCALARANDIPLIHISTCYVNGYNRGKITEQVFPATGKSLQFHPAGYYEVEELIQELQQKISNIRATASDINTLNRKLLEFGHQQARQHGWNDSYTFTKWLGEQLALKIAGQGHLTIVRPAIIESTLQEPVPGWIEGVKVVDTLTLAYARAKLPVFPYQPQGILDVIPADLVANSIVLAAADMSRRGKGVRIIQCCSGSRNPLTLGNMADYVNQEIHGNWETYQHFGTRRPPRPFRPANKLLFWSSLYLRGFLYAAASPLVATMNFAPFNAALKRFRSFHALVMTHHAYGCPDYVFDNTKTMELAASFSPGDQALFPVDPALVDWKRYFCRYHFHGLDKYVLKAPPGTAAAGKLPKKVASIQNA